MQNERNALSFGWHIGYYAFVLVTASKGSGRKIDAQTSQVMSIIRPRLVELSTYFKVDADFSLPSSPAEAKLLATNLDKLRQARSGLTLSEKLVINFGRRVGSYYELGSKIINYALVEGRVEPETRALTSSLKADIEHLTTFLGMKPSLITEVMHSQGLMLSIDALERHFFPEESRQTDRGRVAYNPWIFGIILFSSNTNDRRCGRSVRVRHYPSRASDRLYWRFALRYRFRVDTAYSKWSPRLLRRENRSSRDPTYAATFPVVCETEAEAQVGFRE